MSGEIREQWNRLFELRDRAKGKTFTGESDDLRDEIDALATDLEQWARTAEAGELLDWVCAKWMGWGESLPDNLTCSECGAPITGYDSGGSCASCTPPWPRYSESPGAAMELLLRMANAGHLDRIDFTKGTLELYGLLDWLGEFSPGNFEPLDIARAAAVLCARGVEVDRG